MNWIKIGFGIYMLLAIGIQILIAAYDYKKSLIKTSQDTKAFICVIIFFALQAVGVLILLVPDDIKRI